jgi:hypothetical protein
MSEPIKVGDLVMFVHSCCIAFRDGVSIFTVSSIRPSRPSGRCSGCWKTLPDERYASDSPKYPGAPISWLKRIPPLSELGDVENKEEQHA